MGKTSIEWTDCSWNPIVGCSEISPGCAHCYAARLAATRLRETPQYKDLANPVIGERKRVHWTGEVRFLPERLEEPLHWHKPRKIFVCDMGDLFHESVTHEQLKLVFCTIAIAQHHTFQVLTKRPARMKEFLNHPDMQLLHRWPMKNLWLGVSVENQHFADERIPLLLKTPAAVRWISAEPLLGSVNLNVIPRPDREISTFDALQDHTLDGRASAHVQWVVCGGESGPNARPMHPDWARSLRDQCQSAGVPYFFKQWGEFAPAGQIDSTRTFAGHNLGDGQMMLRYGKKLAGRVLDGRTWDEFPLVTGHCAPATEKS